MGLVSLQAPKSAGANVTFTTILGNDDLKDFVIDDLKKSNIKLNTIIDDTRPTTNKNTILSDVYKLLKVDKVDNQPISEKNLNKIKFFIKKIKCDAIIFSDFRHGIFNKTILELINQLKRGTRSLITSCNEVGEYKD